MNRNKSIAKTLKSLKNKIKYNTLYSDLARYVGRASTENSIILYFIFIMSITSLVYFAGQEDFNTVAVFITIGFVISFFNKNMIIVLFFALVGSYLYKYGVEMLSGVGEAEGLKSGKDVSDDDNDDDEEGMTEGINEETTDTPSENTTPPQTTDEEQAKKEAKVEKRKAEEALIADENTKPLPKTPEEAAEKIKRQQEIINKLIK
jgi:hypothetical protein